MPFSIQNTPQGYMRFVFAAWQSPPSLSVCTICGVWPKQVIARLTKSTVEKQPGSLYASMNRFRPASSIRVCWKNTSSSCPTPQAFGAYFIPIGHFTPHLADASHFPSARLLCFADSVFLRYPSLTRLWYKAPGRLLRPFSSRGFPYIAHTLTLGFRRCRLRIHVRFPFVCALRRGLLGRCDFGSSDSRAPSYRSFHRISDAFETGCLRKRTARLLAADTA